MLALSARLRRLGDVLISSCGMCCDVLLAHRLASSFVSSVGSVHHLFRPVLRHGWRGVGRLLRAIRSPFRFLTACLVPLCLLASGPVVPVPRSVLMWMAAGGLRSVGSMWGLLVCLSRCIRAVPPLVARSFPFMARRLVRLMRLCAVARCCGYEFGGCHSLPCVIPSSPIVCGCLRRAG